GRCACSSRQGASSNAAASPCAYIHLHLHLHPPTSPRRSRRGGSSDPDRGGARAGTRATAGRRGDARRRPRGSGRRDGRRGVSPRHVPATVHELSRVALLAGLPGETLAALARRMRREEVAAGTAIVAEGDGGDRFYVVLSGILTASQASLGARAVL